jgi:hypothetical protein
MHEIRRGDADVMIAGGAEAAVTPVCVSVFARMKALSTRNAEPARASRPFDRERDGFVMAEGAAAFVLETEEHARRRGAEILAVLVGGGVSSDASHITAPDPEGRGAILSMRRALKDARLDAKAIDYVNAHGTSTPLGDPPSRRREGPSATARKVSISSTKSMHGHHLGASGAVETIACVNALRKGVVPPTINLEDPDEGFDLDFVPKTAKERPVRVAMNNTFGFGHGVTLILPRRERRGRRARGGRVRGPRQRLAPLAQMVVTLCACGKICRMERTYTRGPSRRIWGRRWSSWPGQGGWKTAGSPCPQPWDAGIYLSWTIATTGRGRRAVAGGRALVVSWLHSGAAGRVGSGGFDKTVALGFLVTGSADGRHRWRRLLRAGTPAAYALVRGGPRAGVPSAGARAEIRIPRAGGEVVDALSGSAVLDLRDGPLRGWRRLDQFFREMCASRARARSQSVRSSPISCRAASALRSH